MHLTIARTTDLSTEQKVFFNKAGDKYIVYLSDIKNGEGVSKQFETDEEQLQHI